MSTASGTPEPAGGMSLKREVRNPRRRQRSDGESLRAAPRRKRSKIDEDTYAPRGSIEDADGIMVDSIQMNGHASDGRRSHHHLHHHGTDHDLEIPVRGGKKGTVKRSVTKGDNATVLTTNSIYTVKLLPSTPKELREGAQYRGSVLSTASGHQHLALAVTRGKAYVWDYSAHAAVSNGLRTFDLPFAVREGEILPFGALVAGTGAGAGAEVGLLLVSATTGQVAYYESIERAASLGLFREKKSIAVEGTISGHYSSETILELVSAEHAGYVLTTSSGRIIQLTLRDAQGRARILSQALRPGDAAGGGLFGSFRGLLTNPWRQRVSAVKTRPLDQRGRMQAITMTERCETQAWDIDWSGHYEFRGTVDFKDLAVVELKSSLAREMQGRAEAVSAVDFAILDKPQSTRGNEMVKLGFERPTTLLVLLRVGERDDHDYWTIELSLYGDQARVERLVALDGYRNARASRQTPRLLLPSPGHTGMIAFDDAILLASTTTPDLDDNPNTQLLEASYLEPRPFEDTIHLCSGKGLAILGACTEETRSGNASTVVFIQGAGLVRIWANDPAGDKERERIPAKTRIEQAVFYGAMQDNILDFALNVDTSHSANEVESATLAISNDILQSTTPFIPLSPASVEAHLGYRARALRALVSYVRANYPILSKTTLWQLLWDAEKIAAAQAMWKTFEEHKAAGIISKKKRSATVIDELVAQLEHQYGLPELEMTGQDDTVRRFFIKGLSRIDHILSHIKLLLETLRDDKSEVADRIVRFVAEADELWARALETTFAFRVENATAYGINPQTIKDGILDDAESFAGLPEFWTATKEMLKAGSKIASLSRDLAKDMYEQEQTEEPTPELDEYVSQIRSSNPRLVQLCCLMYRERIGWLASRESAKDRNEARDLQEGFEAERHAQFHHLASIGLAEEGMALAERYQDMQTLTELVVGESQYLISESQTPDINAVEQQAVNKKLQDISDRTTRYFEKFGDDWANAFFDEGFSGPQAGTVLQNAQEKWRVQLTRYLRAEPTRGKICWINDVLTEKDYRHAADVLIETAQERERRLWTKKVEVSMSKLALLAAAEESGSSGETSTNSRDRELEIVEVQERVYSAVQLEARTALDQETAVFLVMDRFGSKIKEYPSLAGLLSVQLERVLDHQALSVEELIDVLTLMDTRLYADEDEEPDESLGGAEFVYALKALNAAAPNLPQGRFETLLALIWKRCFAYDDWVDITSATTTKKKPRRTDNDVKTSFRATAAWRTFWHLYNDCLLTKPECHIRILPPSECLGAGCRPEDLSHRFADPGILDPIVMEQRVLDEVLKGFVVDWRLDAWMADVEADARRVVEGEVEREAERRGRLREVASVAETGVNGHVLTAKDGDGDLMMA
ncbi:Non-repetitive/WGA-negative nucleoporin C-terminal [Teratosphaeria destructans]|uniref:Non-repetitive/WGA-negative nucleoporin C-terminal n=1 Tax=Teratosphaeria destructans TaxID=418781 RepID=A0A9W7W791_9PEZI|nr:Non-repetitive/WGA-negative nucleoporin C-terminal [Teratosphaeria destructans]